MSASESSSKPSGLGQKAQAAAKSAATSIKTQAGDLADRAKETVTDMADQRRTEAADTIEGVSSALNKTADSIEQEDPNIAWLTQQASHRLEKAAEYVRSISWKELRADSESLARRHPVAFFGGMFAIGAAAGALIKAGVKTAASTSAQAPDERLSHPPLEEPSQHINEPIQSAASI